MLYGVHRSRSLCARCVPGLYVELLAEGHTQRAERQQQQRHHRFSTRFGEPTLKTDAVIELVLATSSFTLIFSVCALFVCFCLCRKRDVDLNAPLLPMETSRPAPLIDAAALEPKPEP